MNLITPTYIPKSAADLQVVWDSIHEFVQCIHLDIDDGVFTEMFSWPYESAGVLSPIELDVKENQEISVHLMVQNVEPVGVEFAKAGVHTVMGHIEAFVDDEDAQRALGAWREAGAREAGLAILIDTDIARLEPVISECDFVHVLSVAKIGAQGEVFDVRAIERIATLRALYPHLIISVDGGVNETNINSLVEAGANRFAIGSAIMHTSNPAESYVRLKMLAESALQ